MAIQKEIILRYRAEGHVRFQLPAQLCSDNAADAVSNAVGSIDGVYRVSLYRRQRKLSIRFNEAICDFKSLAHQLFQVLGALECQGALKPKSSINSSASNFWRKRGEQETVSKKGWFREKYGEVKETLHAAKIITKLGIKKPKALIKDPEKAVIDFLNDILVLFLIKLHWQNITQQWVVKPLKYRYEWMAVFYMFFLLIRSRKPK